MQLYKNILLAIDCSYVDAAIVGYISLLARKNRATGYLLHVVHSHTPDQARDLRAEGETVLSAHCTTLSKQDVEAHIINRSGEPEEKILEEIEGGNYDLVAIAKHGHTILGDILFGSVSSSLKHKITIPLLLLKSTEQSRSRK